MSNRICHPETVLYVDEHNKQQHGGRRSRSDRPNAAEVDRNYVRTIRQRHQNHDKIGVNCPEQFQGPGGHLPSDGGSPRIDLWRSIPNNGDVVRLVPLHPGASGNAGNTVGLLLLQGFIYSRETSRLLLVLAVYLYYSSVAIGLKADWRLFVVASHPDVSCS